MKGSTILCKQKSSSCHIQKLALVGSEKYASRSISATSNTYAGLWGSNDAFNLPQKEQWWVAKIYSIKGGNKDASVIIAILAGARASGSENTQSVCPYRDSWVSSVMLSWTTGLELEGEICINNLRAQGSSYTGLDLKIGFWESLFNQEKESNSSLIKRGQFLNAKEF